MSGAGQSSGTMTDAQRKWTMAFLGRGDGAAPATTTGADDTGADQTSGGGGKPATQVVPASLPQGATASGMKDEDIAAAIMDKQAAILVGWETALHVFETTMNSAADAEATPDFQKAIVTYFADKLMGEMIKKTPGGAELAAFAGAIAGEAKRAATAGASAKLRDFIVQYAKTIGSLHQSVLSQRQGFISAVRARREAAEPQPGGKKKGKWTTSAPTKTDDDYAMMRMELMDTLDQVDARLKGATPEALFRTLSEEWVRHGTVVGGMGVKFQAVVVIRIDPGYQVMDAHIQGAGGQKLAEQMLKDNPDGVDVWGLKTQRVVKMMEKNGWWSAIVTVDANNADKSTGSIIEGKTGEVYKVLMSKGLPKTKKLTGD